MKIISPLRHLWHRPVLLSAAVLGALVGWTAAQTLPAISATLVGWSAGVFLYLAMAIWQAKRSTTERIKQRADILDEGAAAILLVTAAAPIASLVALAFELAKIHGLSRNDGAVVLAVVTVVLSWMFLHTVFAFHYAHEYYNGRDEQDCGLDFPGSRTPTYWDFAYFSFIVGMTAQVADVQTTSSKMRQLVLAHSVVSFFFNTAILALGVNLAAGLLG